VLAERLRAAALSHDDLPPRARAVEVHDAKPTQVTQHVTAKITQDDSSRALAHEPLARQ
jgi:hypothetical protein